MLKRLFYICLCVITPILIYTACNRSRASELHCMAAAIYHESNNEPEHGKLAVASVILNRVDHPRYPSTVCGNVAMRGQFPWYHRKGLKYNESSLTLAKKILSNKGRVLPKNVIYFNTRSTAFAKGKRLHQRIGNHYFYSDAKKS